MEYQQCHRHLKSQWKLQQDEWLEGSLTCNCIQRTTMRVKRTPRYYQHHAALTLTLTTITVLLSLHLVLLGDAVSAVDVDPQESDKVLLPTLDGKYSLEYQLVLYRLLNNRNLTRWDPNTHFATCPVKNPDI